MKIKIPTKSLKDIISFCTLPSGLDEFLGYKIVSEKIEDKGYITVYASNGIVFIENKVECEVIESGTVFCEKILSNVVSKISGQELTLNATQKAVTIKSGKTKVTVKTFDGIDFPLFDEILKDTTYFTLSKKDIEDLNSIKVFTGGNKDIEDLKFVKIDKNALFSSDGRRIATSKLDSKDSNEEYYLHPTILNVLLSHYKDQVNFGKKNNYIIFTDQNSRVVCIQRFDVMQYPNLEKAFDVMTYSNSFVIEKEQLKDIIDYGMSLTEDSDVFRVEVIFKIEGNKLYLNAVCNERIVETEEIQLSDITKIDNVECKFNGKYLFDVLNYLDNSIEISFNNASIPFMFKDNKRKVLTVPLKE